MKYESHFLRSDFFYSVGYELSEYLAVKSIAILMKWMYNYGRLTPRLIFSLNSMSATL